MLLAAPHIGGASLRACTPTMALTTKAPQRARYFPFSPAPSALSGYVGAADGFDPLGISDSVPMWWLREAELKHGRIAMLAFVGFVVPDAFPSLLLDNGVDAASIAAHDASLGAYGGPLGQVWLFVAILEVLVGLPALNFSASGGERAAGDYAFDPLGFNKGTAAQRDEMAYKELVHGRTAMLAFAGVVTQAGMGHSFPYW